MPSTKLFFENESQYTLYVLLNSDAGTLEIHLYDAPHGNAEAIEPNRGISFDVDAQVQSCIHDEKLRYAFESHTKGPAAGKTCFVPGGSRRAEGPIFLFEDNVRLN